MMQRWAVVEQREYEVAARPSRTNEAGEEVPKSDRIATAIRVAQHASSSGYPARLVDEEDGEVSAVVELGDASEEKFEDAARVMLEAASW